MRFCHHFFQPLLLSLSLLLLVVCVESSLAATPNPGELELKTERVIVFKDGYSLIIKHGTATSDEKGQVFTDAVPDAAVLGSFWAIPDEGRLVSTVAGWKTTEETEAKEVPCTQAIEILLSNKGKSAKVELHDKTIYNGVIREVLVEQLESAIAEPLLSFLDSTHGAAASGTRRLLSRASEQAGSATRSHTLTAINGSNFILRTDEGDVFLPVAQIRTLVVKDMKTTVAKTLKSTRRDKRLCFTFAEKEKKQALTLMYFRPGIRWIPTYRVQLNEDQKNKTAEMSLQAELLNEAEDLNEVPIDIVVGVPNFRFRDTPSPLVLEAVLRNALAQAAPQLMGNSSNSLSNAMYSQRSAEFRLNQAQANDVGEGAEVALPGELTAAGAQDLFVYKLPEQTLAKGERCAIPIFTTQVPYRDIYTWDVQVTRNDVEAAPSGSGIQSPLKLGKNQVWHQVALVNNTKLPWTTGAAMIMHGNQPLAQELLTYTPPKDEVRVPVTVAVDLRGSLTEKEVGRELEAVTWAGHNYARIAKEMKLDLCNNKSIPIEAEITVRVGGKVVEASDEGDVNLSAFNPADWENYQGNPAVNNSSQVTWKTKLKPGESFTPTLDYHYFTRH
jgi:hypothetical protein